MKGFHPVDLSRIVVDVQHGATARRKTDMVVTPKMFSVGYSAERRRLLAEAADLAYRAARVVERDLYFSKLGS